MTTRDTVAITSFIPYIRPEVPGCPDLMIEQKLMSTLIDFCAKTDIWQEDIDSSTLIPAVKEIEIDVPDGTTLNKILRLRYKDTKEIVATSVDWLDRNEPNWRTKTSGVGDYFIHTGKATIQLVGHASEVETLALRGRMSLKPKRTATTVYDMLYEDYCEAIAAGTKASLMAMSAKEWTNPEMAQVYSLAYVRTIDEATVFAQAAYASRVRRRTRAYF